MELDKRIAVEVMGWKIIWENHSLNYPCYTIPDKKYKNTLNPDDVPYERVAKDWNPSTNISDAWLVIEKMRERGYKLFLTEDSRGYVCHFETKVKFASGVNMSAPMAISLAALKSITED